MFCALRRDALFTIPRVHFYIHSDMLGAYSKAPQHIKMHKYTNLLYRGMLDAALRPESPYWTLPHVHAHPLGRVAWLHCIDLLVAWTLSVLLLLIAF